MKQILLSKIQKEDFSKLNLMSLNLTEPVTYDTQIIHQKSLKQSTFYNTQNLESGKFYKNPSLLIK